jgi:hypothetical protein
LGEGCESSVDLAFGGGFQDRELHPLGARSVLTVSHDALGILIGRVHQQDKSAGLGNQLGKQLKPLGHQFNVEKADTGEVAARPGEAGD